MSDDTLSEEEVLSSDNFTNTSGEEEEDDLNNEDQFTDIPPRIDREFIKIKNKDNDVKYVRNGTKLVSCMEWEIDPQYEDAGDLISDGINGGLDTIIKLHPEMSTFQLKLGVNMKKIVAESDESDSDIFWIQMLEVDRPNCNLFPQEFEEWRSNLFTKLHERIQNQEQRGSNWTYTSVSHLGIIFGKIITDGRITNSSQMRVGQWVPLPEKLPGKLFLYNLKTNKNCLNTCIATWLCQDLFLERSTNDRKIKIILNNWNKFRFPNLEKDGYISFSSLPIYEKQFNTDIIVYQVYENKAFRKTFQIAIVRKGTRPDLPEKNRLYLVLIGETNHVVLVKKDKVQSFIRNFRTYHSKCDFIYCIYCFRGMNKTKICQHKSFCHKQNGVRNIRLPKKGDLYKFTKFSAMQPAPLIIVADTETIQRKCDSGIKDGVFTHELVSYGFNVLCNEKIVHSEIKTGSNPKKLCREFVHNMFESGQACFEEEKKKWYINPTLTCKDKKDFERQNLCKICENKFKDSLDKHRHHDWMKKPVYKNGICIEGNYLYALCRRCNTSISLKQRTISVIMHNSGKFDNKFIITGLGKHYEIRENSIISKSGETFMQFSVQKKNLEKYQPRFILRFIDSINFLSGSLETLVKSLKSHGNCFKILEEGMKQQGFDDPELLSLVTQKCYFPYEFVNSYDKLLVKDLPAISAFDSILTNKSITSDQYKFAQKMFHLGKCTNMKQFMELYLLVDILLLSEVINSFRKICIEVYKLDPCAMTTTPSLAMESALLTKKFNVELLWEQEIVDLIKEHLKGGYVGVVIGHMIMLDRAIDPYTSILIELTAILADVNSLYPYILSRKIPIGEYHKLSQVEIGEFENNYKEIDLDGDYAYLVLFTYKSSDSVRRNLDDFPVIYRNQSIDPEDLSSYTKDLMKECGYKLPNVKTLLATHEDGEYFTTLGYLRLMESVGIEIVEIKDVYRFHQEAIFKEFIDRNIELRKHAKTKFEKDLYKLFSNAIFGKLLFNIEKYCLQTFIVTDAKSFQSKIKNPLLSEMYPIGDEKMIMKIRQKSVTLSHPQYCGFFVLEEAKRHMGHLFHNVIRKTFPDVRCAYTDTDSFLLIFKNINIIDSLHETPLFEYFDTSNFHSDHAGYSQQNAFKLGLLKSETGSVHIKEFVCLSPKCYCIKLADSKLKSASKGTRKTEKEKISFEHYLKIHKSELLRYQAHDANIICKRNKLHTIARKKRALSKIEKKRVWVDANTSYAYGHPNVRRRGTKRKNDSKPQPKKMQAIKTIVIDSSVDENNDDIVCDNELPTDVVGHISRRYVFNKNQ